MKSKIWKRAGLACLLLLGLGVALMPSWRNYWLPRRGLRIQEDLAYGGGREQKLDLYLPSGSSPAVVVFLHGGFWKPLDRRVLQPITGLHGTVGVALAGSGVATAVVGYRQFPEAATVGDALEDVAQSIRWVSENLSGDIYVVGHSAGGLLASLLALEPEHLAKAGVSRDRIRGFASLAAPYDLERLASSLGGDLGERVRRSDPGQHFSPEKNIRSDHPPLLLIVGDADSLLEEQRHMAAALRLAGAPATTVEIPGAGHMDLIMHLWRPDDQVRADLLRFIHQH